MPTKNVQVQIDSNLKDAGEEILKMLGIAPSQAINAFYAQFVLCEGCFLNFEKETLTTQQAADFLNISRPFLVKLIDVKELPSFKVRKHRQVFKSDLLTYKEISLKERKKILQKLVDEAQDLNLGY